MFQTKFTKYIGCAVSAEPPRSPVTLHSRPMDCSVFSPLVNVPAAGDAKLPGLAKAFLHKQSDFQI